ncbi:hypothetical protein AVEN_153536-1 [Araneus ventricosus]|uniref:Uncharacterized protein n=1 Tax=Araneus ventricosus TaxID=182803 RepID=A0A4Y2G8I7_ARAVE|nr:hypothetical protein AVEN_153536-1 [Araneus ventricosus]
MPNRLHLIARNTCWGSELFLTYDNKFDFGRRIEKADSLVDMMLQVGPHIYTFEWQIMVEIFDITVEAWVRREVPAMPSDYGTTITLGGKLYYIGYSILSIYEFEKNGWEIKTRARDNLMMGAAELNKQIFIVGVHNMHGVMMCQIYDSENNTWISLPAPNIQREGFLLLT